MLLCVPAGMPLPPQDEALDSEGPRLAFEEMARQVNALAATAAAQAGPGATPPAVKTADDVSATLSSDTGNSSSSSSSSGMRESACSWKCTLRRQCAPFA